MTKTTFDTVENTTGYLLAWTLPEVLVKYDDLETIAADTGFPAEFLPSRPAPKSVWEKCTSLGGKGKKLQPDKESIKEIIDTYGVSPRARVYTTPIKSDGSMYQVRHLVLEMTVGSSRTEDSSVRKTAANQRKNQTLYLIRYNADAENPGECAQFIKVPDQQESYVEAEVDALVNQMLIDIQNQLEKADSQDIRAGIRRYLEKLHRIPMNQSGGVYCVPVQSDRDVAEDVATLKSFIDGVRPYAVKKDSLPKCLAWRVTPSGDAFDLGSDIVESAISDILRRMKSLNSEAKKIPSKKGKFQERAAENAAAEWGAIQASLSVYAGALGNQMIELQSQIMDMRSAMTGIAMITSSDNVSIVGPEVALSPAQIIEGIKTMADEGLNNERIEAPVKQVVIGGFELNFDED